ncbi:MAG TPA: 3-hydroxyacyl-CoA dehydrogenase NAD-binding domain-containing protein [Phnomibacter sp.]|nr:3-hydroxyacyl-CoA dehydrogenase NAD-binding domain-containing protein [Phnomibacter sp.]
MPLQETEGIKTIAICGAGTMGNGIAQLAAQAGFSTLLFDVQEAVLEQAQQTIAKNLAYLLQKQKITKTDLHAITQRISYTHTLAHCKADVVIEAIVEKAEIKIALFKQLAAINEPTTLLATNTSSLSVNALQQHIPIPGRFAGMHFFNPPVIMKLVEIVSGAATLPTTATRLYQLAQALGKTPVHCKDTPGFIVNRVARPYYLEAMRLLEASAATMNQIDEVMEATGCKMGPFKLMDLIGLDINYSASQGVWQGLGQPERLKPAALQQAKVAQGHLGRKSGQGFYNYE